MLSSEQVHGSKQTYWGTRGYVAPELFENKESPIDFIKCDIWALALLLWETLAGGSRYFNDSNVLSLITSKQQANTESSISARSDDTEQASASRPGHDVYSISDSLSAVASTVVDKKAEGSGISLMSKNMLKQIFHLSLQVNTLKRCGDISRLPFTYGTRK